jgi:hypothetical protein
VKSYSWIVRACVGETCFCMNHDSDDGNDDGDDDCDPSLISSSTHMFIVVLMNMLICCM